MITTGQVELGEEAGATSPIQQRVNVRERLDRRARDGIETTVVVADAPRPVRFPCKHDRGSMTCRRVLNPAAVE